MNDQNLVEKKPVKTHLWLAILALGSIAGLIEVVAGGLLREAKFGFTSGLLTGLGFAVIAFGLVIFKKPLMGIGIGLVAVLCKLLIVPVLHVSAICGANSCLAVLLEYGALTGIVSIMGSKMQGRAYKRALIGGGAALVGSMAFYYLGMRVAPCNYLLTFKESGMLSFVMKEGSSWIIFSAILFPLGWLAGQKSADKILVYLNQKPRIIYGGAGLTVILCWLVSAIGISQGL